MTLRETIGAIRALAKLDPFLDARHLRRACGLCGCQRAGHSALAAQRARRRLRTKYAKLRIEHGLALDIWRGTLSCDDEARCRFVPLWAVELGLIPGRPDAWSAAAEAAWQRCAAGAR